MKLVWFYGKEEEFFLNLPNDRAQIYWEMITVIEAQQMLVDFKVAVFPKMSKADRQKALDEIHKQAYPKALSGERPMSIQDLAVILNG